MIILEGADGAGKTTLKRKLQEHFGFEEGKRGVGNRDRLYEVTRKDTKVALAHAVKASEAPLIWDRLFFADFVYAPVQGRPIAFTPMESTVVQGIIDLLACPIILCCPPLEEVAKNITKEKQMAGVKDNIVTIWSEYNKMFMPDGLFYKPNVFPALHYDYTGSFPGKVHGAPWTDSVNIVIDHIEEYLEGRKEREAWTI